MIKMDTMKNRAENVSHDDDDDTVDSRHANEMTNDDLSHTGQSRTRETMEQSIFPSLTTNVV